MKKEKQSYIKLNVGIDVGKDELKVCLSGMMSSFAIETLEQQVYTNDKKGWKSLSNRLGVRINPKEESVHCTMEATGVYHEGVARNCPGYYIL
jgi:transposase